MGLSLSLDVVVHACDLSALGKLRQEDCFEFKSVRDTYRPPFSEQMLEMLSGSEWVLLLQRTQVAPSTQKVAHKHL